MEIWKVKMRRRRRREGKGEGSEVRKCVKDETFCIIGIMRLEGNASSKVEILIGDESFWVN